MSFPGRRARLRRVSEGRHCESPADLRNIAEKRGRELPAGAVVALRGPLGAGKTEFTKGLAAGLEAPGPVTSPTFALLQEYHGGRLPLYHLDFYRLEEAQEVLDLGWDELLEAGGVVVVEWPELFPDLIPADATLIDISHVPGGGRVVCERPWSGAEVAGE